MTNYAWKGRGCSFILRGQGSSLPWTPALRPYSGPLRLPRERKGIGRCVRCVSECKVKEGLSRSEQLVGYFYSVHLLGVAYCLAKPWLALCITPTSGQPSLFASTHAGAASRLDTARSRCLQLSQFIEDTVEPSFFLLRIISLFIMRIGIIRNNSLVGGRARAQSNPGQWARHVLLPMAEGAWSNHVKHRNFGGHQPYLWNGSKLE